MKTAIANTCQPTSPPRVQASILEKHPCPPRRVLELFAGIGGLAAAWPEADIAAAIDISQLAAKIYQQNFSHRYVVQEIASLSQATLKSYEADFWWLSPPCQPFSRRGKQADINDPRCAGLQRITRALGECQPAGIGLENVHGFVHSRAHELLVEQLERHGYHVLSTELCPTQLGWPNRRPRFYLLAAQQALGPWQPLPTYQLGLKDLLNTHLTQEEAKDQQLLLSDEHFQKYHEAIDRVELGDPRAITACFAASYGKTLLQAGSYVRCGQNYRRFSPNEMARLLGFSEQFTISGTTHRGAWKLLGNSLSLPVLRYVLGHLPQP
jgi:site-specific DNA-cytosine methylase